MSVRGGGWGRGGKGEERGGQRCGEGRAEVWREETGEGRERVERRGRSGAGEVGMAGEEGRGDFSVCTLQWDVITALMSYLP